MTPEQIGQLIAACILALISAGTGTGATLFVQRRQSNKEDDRYTTALVKLNDANERIDDLEDTIRNYDEQEQANAKKIISFEAQVNLLDRQRIEVEQRRTDAAVEVALERETFKQSMERQMSDLNKQIDVIRKELNSVKQRNVELERINSLLEDRQKECDDFERENTELHKKLKEADKKIDGLERLVKRLSDNHSPEPDSAAPPAPPHIVDSDGAKTQAEIKPVADDTQDQGRKIA